VIQAQHLQPLTFCLAVLICAYVHLPVLLLQIELARLEMKGK
jgi:hypothetical protein